MHYFRLLVFVTLVSGEFHCVCAADNVKKPAVDQPKFELRDGDRVVFLGNTLIERAQKYGYWETMLTARYPNKNMTFRNLGWSGDTVWAESRGMFDPPAVGYKRMIEHVGRLKPTVVFVGYGNNEAFAGKAGLPAFIKQYNKLLDDLTRVSAEGVRFVILSPVRIDLETNRRPNRSTQNRNRALYRTALSDISGDRNMFFIDLYSHMQSDYRDYQLDEKDEPLVDQAWQLNDRGYFWTELDLHSDLFVMHQLERGLFLDYPKLEITADGKVKSQARVKATNVKLTTKGLTVEIVSHRLRMDSLDLKVSGLAAGKYDVKVGRQVFAKTDNVLLSKGIAFRASHPVAGEPAPHEVQYKKLRETIIAKNRLYFYRWRPQNFTYLFGFRKHEQGQNAKELAEFDTLIAAKEQEINTLKKPVARTYEIIRVNTNQEK